MSNLPATDRPAPRDVKGPDLGGHLLITWLDDCGATLRDALVRWSGRVFPGVDVRPGPDVRAGAEWQHTLPRSLRGARAALVGVVGEQAASPWVHLQLGACFRALGTRKPVVPVLLDVPDTGLSSSPLGMFQAVRPTESDFRTLVRDLARALADADAERAALERFAATVDELLSDLDAVPGTAVHDFQIVLVLPDRVFPVPNSAPLQDEVWSSVMSRMTAIQHLPGFCLAPFAQADLEPLDLSREAWMRVPRLVSRLTTRNVALVHRDVAAHYQREAKAIAKFVKRQLVKYEDPRLRFE